MNVILKTFLFIKIILSKLIESLIDLIIPLDIQFKLYDFIIFLKQRKCNHKYKLYLLTDRKDKYYYVKDKKPVYNDNRKILTYYCCKCNKEKIQNG